MEVRPPVGLITVGVSFFYEWNAVDSCRAYYLGYVFLVEEKVDEEGSLLIRVSRKISSIISS